MCVFFVGFWVFWVLGNYPYGFVVLRGKHKEHTFYCSCHPLFWWWWWGASDETAWVGFKKALQKAKPLSLRGHPLFWLF